MVLPSAPITKADIYVFRAPIEKPVRTSFGTMHDRPAVLLRLEDADGAYGWGESFSNFPACGAEHRARLLETVIAPLLLGKCFPEPAAAFADLTRRVEVLALQADEPGPLAQTVSCADIALWDITARKMGLPLHSLLGEAAMSAMPAYASGINHPEVEKLVSSTRAEGYRAFKVKIGFGEEQDFRNIQDALSVLEAGETLAVDVNQAWDLPTALRRVKTLGNLPLTWIEEPLRCDSPEKDWKELAAASDIPLAAGENMRGRATFSAAIACGAFGVLQPDICKWGGLSQCREVAREIIAAGLRYCPHYLGGGVGLLASAHLLAAVGGTGSLEVDCNPNPLRKMLAQPFPKVSDGLFILGDAPGIGVEPDIKGLKEFMVLHVECS